MKKLLILLAALLVLSVGSASAFPLWPGHPQQASTQFEDDNLDFWTDVDKDNLISKGDVLTSVIEFGQAFHFGPNYAQIPGDTVQLDRTVDDLVALSIIEVLSVDAATGFMTFGEYQGGAMVQFYTGGPIDLLISDGNLDVATATAAVTDGTHLWDFSVTADADTFWNFTPIDPTLANNPAEVKLLTPVTKVGTVNYALNQVWGNDIFNDILNPAFVADDGLVDLIGSGDILGGFGLTYAFARSDIDVLLNPIPEPATLTLFGFSLLGLAFVGRRRK